MKRLFVLAAISVCLSLAATAQKSVDTRFSLGPELGFATGTFSNVAGFGIGGTIQAEHFYQPYVSGTAIFGFVNYFGTSHNATTNNKSTLIIPIRVGIRFYTDEGFHVGAQFGIGLISSPFSSTTSFAYSPQIGYNFKTKTGRHVDATFKYDGYAFNDGSFTALGIRIAYIL